MKSRCVVAVLLAAFLAAAFCGCAQLQWNNAQTQQAVYLVVRDATVFALQDTSTKPPTISATKLAKADLTAPYLEAAKVALESTDEATLKASIAQFIEARVATDASVTGLLARDALETLLADTHFTKLSVMQSQAVADGDLVVRGMLDGIAIAHEYANKSAAAGVK
jgi:hypothetical protein